MSPFPLNRNNPRVPVHDTVGLVRSIQPRTGLNELTGPAKGPAFGSVPLLGINETAAHPAGLVTFVSPAGPSDPSGLLPGARHGSLIVGSVRPAVKFSVSRVC